ncbi:hypothetical protein SDJN02_00658, partial [Cucurbita argyrosperma subsp. argyrosperma]
MGLCSSENRIMGLCSSENRIMGLCSSENRIMGLCSSENRIMGLCSSENLRCHDCYGTNTKPTQKGEGNGGGGVHFQPLGFANGSNNSDGDEILKLFDILSSLKFAYLQFQKAHIPYEPKKIIVADELIVTQLEALWKIKRALKQNHFNAIESKSLQHDFLKEKVRYQEKLLEELKSKLEAQNIEARCLKQQLRDSDSRNEMLGEKVMKRGASSSSINGFEETFIATYKSIHDFAKPLIALMKASRWDLDVAAKSIAESAVFFKRSDKKYAFEAYIARRMFYEMSYEPWNIEDVKKFDDPIEFSLMNPNSEFGKFCQRKYLLVVHPVMEASFFGNLDHRTLVQCGKHPRTLFYQIFAKMAKWVWILGGIAASAKAEAFVVRNDSMFLDTFMESVKGDEEVLEGRCSYTVGFMVMPGFRLGKTLIKSRVYVSRSKLES